MYVVNMEVWMLDQETADFLATDQGWLDVQYQEARDVATANGQTPTGSVTLDSYTQTGVANDGLLYNFVFNVETE